MKKASFTKMTEGTQEDYTPIVEAAMVHSEHLPDRIIQHLNMLKDDFGGFAVDRYAITGALMSPTTPPSANTIVAIIANLPSRN